MIRRRSLLSVKKEEQWTESIEWRNTDGIDLKQAGFNVSFSSTKYDEQNNFITNVVGTSNIQIPVGALSSGIYKKAIIETEVRIDEPAEINGFKTTIKINNAGTQFYVIKSATSGYATLLYDDNIPSSSPHNLENGIFIKDIKLGEWAKYKLEADVTNGNRINRIYLNNVLVYETSNASAHYADTSRVMWQNESTGLMRYLRVAYLK